MLVNPFHSDGDWIVGNLDVAEIVEAMTDGEDLVCVGHPESEVTSGIGGSAITHSGFSLHIYPSVCSGITIIVHDIALDVAVGQH